MGVRVEGNDSRKIHTRPNGRREGRTRLIWLAVLTPIAVTIFSQLQFVQESKCVIAELPWGIGQCEVMADLIAPAWALAIIPIASVLRAAAVRYGTPSMTTGSQFAQSGFARRWAQRSARGAQWGVLLIIVLSYTREWERFNQKPDAVWFVLVVIAVLALLLIPLWWIRDELHRRGSRYLDEGALPRRIDRFLFDESDRRPARWGHLLAFAIVTLVVAFTVLGQFDSLLKGMHLPSDSPSGINGLAGLQEFDLSQKRGTVLERVDAWKTYNEAVGARFGSARTIVTAHAVFDSMTTIPAYLVGGIVLAFYAWRRRRDLATGPELQRAFELVILTGFFVLLLTTLFDLTKNFFSWYVMDRAWTDPELLADANVRILWFATLGRAIGLSILAGSIILLLALAKTPMQYLRNALVAARSEILLVVTFAVTVLMLPQTADVIRGWHVSHTMITVGLAVVWSMLVRWLSVRSLRLQQRHRIEAASEDPPQPPRVRLPLVGTTPTLGRFVGGLVIALAVGQVLLAWLGLSVGRGLLIPAALTFGLWLFGTALPQSSYVRGDRPVDVHMRRRVPRTLGALVYLIIGLAALKAATASVAYARNEDWWLIFALIPPAIGLWRILTRTTSVMGMLEAGFAAVVALLAASLIVGGDPELSPAALSFAGITFAYGSLAYFNSYERGSLVNRLAHRLIPAERVKPFVVIASATPIVTLAWFYADPVRVGPVIGTIGMVVMAMIILTLVGAGAVRFAELTRPPRLLAAFGLKRTPVVTLFLLWLLLAPALADQGITDIRVLAGGDGIQRGLDFDDVWLRWRDANLDSSATATADAKEVVPLLLVSSSGGGLRAAAWTSFVLDCIFESPPSVEGPCSAGRHDPTMSPVALMSGVSGGSLGIATYVAHTLDGVEGPDGGNTWVDEVLGDDYLAAPIGWLFFFDLPRSLIGFTPGAPNRAEIGERAWEKSWPASGPGLSRGIGEVWSDSDLPPVVFNGASVKDGCRVNVSVLDVAGDSPEVPACSGIGSTEDAPGPFGATHDVVDFLCPSDDLALSTAAGMSARFPVVSVAGRIAADQERVCGERSTGAVFVADGGFLEGSGAGSLLDAWIAIRDQVEAFNLSSDGVCIVPFMIHIDNGYESPDVAASDAVPREVLVPLIATLSSSSGITTARAEAALAFEQSFTIGGEPATVVEQTENGPTPIASRYARLVTRAHPGVQAPLGWTLSQASIDDLRDQLAIPGNVAALEEIRTWLDGELLCAEG